MPNLSSFRSIAPSRFAFLALLICLVGPLTARADNRDMVQFGNDIVVHDGEEAHDTVCFLCSIEVDGTVNGDVVAFLGSVRVKGHAEKNAVVFLGSLTLGDDASVGQDVVVFAGNLRTGARATIGRDRVVFPIFIFLLPFLFLAVIVAAIVWAARAMMNRNRPVYPMPPPRY